MTDAPAIPIVVVQFRDAHGSVQDVTMTAAQAREIATRMLAEADRLDPPAADPRRTPGLGEPGR